MMSLSNAGYSKQIPQGEFHMKNAVKLLRLHNETIEALSKYRRGGDQKVTVTHQHVNLESGAQAVVAGNLQVGGGGK